MEKIYAAKLITELSRAIGAKHIGKSLIKLPRGKKEAHNKNAQGWVKGESSDGVAIKSRS